MGWDMLDLLGRWSSEEIEEDILIDAIVVESTVGEVMVAAVMVGVFVLVKHSRVSASGTGTTGAFTSVPKIVAGKQALLEFENTSVEAIFVACLAIG